ncbi:MAG: hypothetical protein PHC28_16305 [Flavobacterium sp.]|uniref:hypothetical protein n=1 Tax=Flavobacterium sp. TaxID=239 RepID=UPI00263816AB|nr:hypothetical protein [Flavobacterium sp.]MDD5152016.1 hypothetical protein [Flavobacterium sp.]
MAALDTLVTTTSNPLLALLKNKTLTNLETWKQIQNLINLLSGTAPLLAFLFPQFAALLTPALLLQLGTAVAAINAYFTTATTSKIGL